MLIFLNSVFILACLSPSAQPAVHHISSTYGMSMDVECFARVGLCTSVSNEMNEVSKKEKKNKVKVPEAGLDVGRRGI